VPFPAGKRKPTSVARKLAEGLRAAFNQPFIVENKPGPTASSRRASGARRADGHTLFVTPTQRIRPTANIYTSLPLRPAEGFRAGRRHHEDPDGAGRARRLPGERFCVLRQLAKAKTLTFGSGNTSRPRAAEMFRRAPEWRCCTFRIAGPRKR